MESPVSLPLPLSGPRLPVTTGAERVLVVEDDPNAQRFFARVLEQAGFEVVVASDGHSAVDALLAGDFCAVVSDVGVPDLTGVDLLRCVRVHDLDVPVVLVTGGADVKTAAEAISYGAFQFLLKPVSGALLVGEVRRAAKLHGLATVRRQAMRLLDVEEGEAQRLDALDEALVSAMSSLWMAYQPIVRADGSLYGYEALMRSDEGRLPSPLAILDAASRLGRLEQLGRVTRARAVTALDTAPPDVDLFINLHARDVFDPTLLDPQGDLAPHASRIVLEITERASLADMRDLRPRVAALRELGFRIAIDDLGAGYAGLSSFISLEPELVKIDMSLIRGVDQNPTKRRLIRMIASTCRDMGIGVIAEGIETLAELETVIDLGCGMVQGYFLARPGKQFPEVSWKGRGAT